MNKLQPDVYKILLSHLPSDTNTKLHTSLINDYAKGKIVSSKPEEFPSGTPFQKKVLKEVYKIPYGQTRSYAEIARAIGKPKAVRAVASAIARNKLLIIIPCHRVIRSDGNIGKYRGGVKLKKQLLDFEKINSNS